MTEKFNNNLNNRKVNNCNYNNNASIEIFEDADPSLNKIFTIESASSSKQQPEISSSGKSHRCHPGCLRFESSRAEKTRSGSSLDSRLNAHVCFAECGLGPEYLQFVKSTSL